MKNIMFIDGRLDKVGGEERSISLLCNELTEQKVFAITIVCLSGTAVAFPLNKDINVIFLQKYYKSKIRRFLHLLRIVKKNRYHLIIGYGITTILYTGIVGRFFKIPIVYCELTNPFVKWYPLKTKIMLFAGKRLLYRQYAVMQSNMIVNYYKNLKKHTVISNILDVDALPEINTWNARDNRAVAAARFSPEKNLPLLINAFVMAHAENPDYILEIYGEGRQEEELVRLVGRHNAGGYIKINPASRDIFGHMNKAKIYVCSSVAEGFSNSLLESMAMGMTPITTDCSGGHKELIDDGVNGIIVPVDDVKAMSEALIRLMENDALAEEMASNAVKVRESNAKEKIIKQWVDFFSEAINDKEPHGVEQINDN